MLLAILVIATAMATILALWAQIVDLFSRIIIPWVRENISQSCASAIADIIAFADGKVVPIRKALKASWKKFKETVLGAQITYTRIGPDSLTARTAMVTRNIDGKIAISEMEEIVDWSSLPESVRNEMIRQNKNSAQFDVHKAVCKKVEETAIKNNLLDVLEN